MESPTSSDFEFSVSPFRGKLLAWYEANKKKHLWRCLWEEMKDPYHVWVSEIMLQQTVIAAMLPVYERFLKRFPTVQSVAQTSDEDLKSSVKGLGYYRRFSLLKKGAEKIAGTSSGVQWPQTNREWLEIPGVGEYTAAAMSSITCNEPVPVLDGNVIRVLSRIFDQRTASNDRTLGRKLRDFAFTLIDPHAPGDFNQAMMELGQTVCRPLNPVCSSCPLQGFCLASTRGSTHLAPLPKVRKEQVAVNIRIPIMRKEGHIGLIPRPLKAKFLRGSLGFPLFLDQSGTFYLDGHSLCELAKGKRLGTFRHNITHHKITAEVFLNRVAPPFLNIQWVEESKVEAKLVSSLDLKAWKIAYNHL